MSARKHAERHDGHDQPIRHDGEVAHPSAEQPDAPAAPAEAKDAADPQQQVDEMFARYQRLAADFENLKRRSRQELADRTQHANAQLIASLLPLLDNFQRAVAHAPKGVDPAWFAGIEMIARQFEETLQAHGVHAIEAVGEPFDPTQHEAIAKEESDEHEAGTVVAEMQRGYRLHDRVLRPTLVKIAEPKKLPPDN
jgi:molecular chaperone GrpE